MYDSAHTWHSYWWIFPVAMMALCFFMMRGRRGAMMCFPGRGHMGNRQSEGTDSAMEILNKRYASGEIDKDEYMERKRTLTESNQRNLKNR